MTPANEATPAPPPARPSAPAKPSEPPPPAPAEPATPLPAPGADLSGPLAPPRARARKDRQADIQPVDLGSDRPAVRVAVPKPPRGGAARFTFGDGREGWVTRLPEGKQLPAVAYGHGKVFVSGGFETYSFYAIDAQRGGIVWSRQTLEDNGATAAVVEDESVIFNTESCTLFVFNAKTGRKRWHRWLGDPTLAQVATTEGLIFAAHPNEDTDGYRLSAFKVKNGRRRWSRYIDSEVLVTPVVHGDSVYVTTLRGRMYRFQHRTGKRLWRKRLKATTAPWIDGQRLYVTRHDNGREVPIVVSTATGEVLETHASVAVATRRDAPRNLSSWKRVWAFEGSRPAVLHGVRYEAIGGRVLASDAQTGQPLWSRRHPKGEGKRSLGSVAVAGPGLVVSTRAGQLYGLDIDTGYTLWAYDLEHNVVAQPIVARGWVYSATKDGRVIGLHVADRSLDGWHMFGGDSHHNGLVAPPVEPGRESAAL